MHLCLTSGLFVGTLVSVAVRAVPDTKPGMGLCAVWDNTSWVWSEPGAGRSVGVTGTRLAVADRLVVVGT